MTQIVEKGNIPRDYYAASLDNGSLVMEPRCACGNILDEDYFCEKCHRKCRCNEIICHDGATLEMVNHFIRKSSQFSGYKARLVGDG
jgi:hypothetical protein